MTITLSNSPSLSQYQTQNYALLPGFTGLYTNITLNTTLARNSIDNPIYIRRGSALPEPGT
jgi:outer membrane protein insertion porin family